MSNQSKELQKDETKDSFIKKTASDTISKTVSTLIAGGILAMITVFAAIISGLPIWLYIPVGSLVFFLVSLGFFLYGKYKYGKLVSLWKDSNSNELSIIPNSEPQAIESTKSVLVTKKSVIEVAGAKIERINRGTNNIISLNKNGSGESPITAFYLKPIANSQPFIDIQSVIKFNDLDSKQQQKFVGCWLKGSEKCITFQTADTNKLIMGLLIGKAVFGYEHHIEINSIDNKEVFIPQLIRFNGKNFEIEVTLTGKYQNEIILDEKYKFRLSVEPELIFEEIKT